MPTAKVSIKTKKKKIKKAEKGNGTSPTELISWPLQIPMTGCPDYFLLADPIRKYVRWYLLPAVLAD